MGWGWGGTCRLSWAHNTIHSLLLPYQWTKLIKLKRGYTVGTVPWCTSDLYLRDTNCCCLTSGVCAFWSKTWCCIPGTFLLHSMAAPWTACLNTQPRPLQSSHQTYPPNSHIYKVTHPPNSVTHRAAVRHTHLRVYFIKQPLDTPT